MALQKSDACRNAALDSFETTVGTSPFLRLYNGIAPVDETAALSGNTLLAEGTLPSDWMAAASTGTKQRTGTWTLTGQAGAGAGTPAVFGRIVSSGGTSHAQFLVGASFAIPTTANTVAPHSVLTFATTAGVNFGMKVTGNNIPDDTFVSSFTGTTVTLSRTPGVQINTGTSISFAYDGILDNNSISVGQVVGVSGFSLQAGN